MAIAVELIVESVSPCRGEFVDFDNDIDYTHYIRYSADNWMVLMGESWETEYQCESLERAYQKFMGGAI